MDSGAFGTRFTEEKLLRFLHVTLNLRSKEPALVSSAVTHVAAYYPWFRQRKSLMKQILALVLLAVLPAFSQTAHVRDWLILGTFPNADGTTRLTKDYVGGELVMSPRGGEVVQGHQWLLYHSPREFVDFLWSDFAFTVHERCVVYAAFFVRSPLQQNVRLLAGSDDAIAVWCNGGSVHTADVVRGLVVDNDTIPLILSAGWNTVIMKIANNEGGYGASARFADGTGLFLTAENPFPASSALSPPGIRSASSSLLFRFSLSDSGGVMASAETALRNVGCQPARNVRFELSTGTQAIMSASVSLAGGELKRVLTDLHLRDVFGLALSERPFTVRLTYQDTDTTWPVAFAGDVLTEFFRPWNLGGWQVERMDDKTERRVRTIVVPEEFAGLNLRVATDIGDLWGSLAVNGEAVLPKFSGDSGELTLAENAVAGSGYTIELIVRSDGGLKNDLSVLATFRPQSERIERYLLDRRFAREIYNIDIGDHSEVTRGILRLLQSHDLRALESVLKPFEDRLAPAVERAKSLTLHMIGNAHIDMAWLWRYTETIDVTLATFRSALDNLRRYPDFRFSHGQAHSYSWVEARDPAMFKEIQKYVQEGRWEITGGTWVESDGNMPSGEAFARQYLYGKRYFKSRFGVDVTNGYHPDTFGHAASLPQILGRSGMQTYTFFRPGDEERMFWWETPDGSRIFAHHPSNWYGTWSGVPDTIWTSAERTRKKFAVNDVVQFFGVGDHGGGPTRRQIEQIEQLGKIQMYPKTRISSFGTFYGALVPQRTSAPVERGEQNFVFEGCYTSQAAIKHNNRKAEALLPAAEIFAAIAVSYGGTYEAERLERAWQNVLFNQFHDILCGSSIHEVAIDADQFYAEAFGMADGVLRDAFDRIAARINTSVKVKGALPTVVFNPLNWTRTDPVSLTLKCDRGHVPRVLDAAGREVPSQIVRQVPDSATIVFLAKDVPSVGYKTFWVTAQMPRRLAAPTSLVMKNRWYEVEVDQKTGWVSRLYDRSLKRELVRPGEFLNQLQIQEDDAPMSAWVIGLKGEPRFIESPSSVRVVESGAVRTVIRSEYAFEQSTFIQDVILYADRPLVDFRFQADWHHRSRILKIAFPLSVSADSVRCDIPFASVNRPTDGREIVAQKWIDLSGAAYGVTLLNDAKYGFDVKGTTVRMTALRSPTDPDPKADEGGHEFRYALCAHAGGWRQGQAVRRGYEFNAPLIAYQSTQHRGTLPSSFSFVQVDNPDLVLSAMKKAEDDNDLVVRIYEASGQPTRGTISFWQSIHRAGETNLIEWHPCPVDIRNIVSRDLVLDWKPTETKTLKLSLGRPQ